MGNDHRPLNAVILETPPSMRGLTGRAKNEALSAYARRALFRSAELSGVTLGPLEKGERGRPVPTNGTFWTVSHTLNFVAAVVAPFAVGIDIEKAGPYTQALRSKLAGPEEWVLTGENSPEAFCRIWTAKEAVLKAVGAGLGGLSRCSVLEIVDERNALLTYESQKWTVSHYYGVTGYVASITVPADDVVWRTVSTYSCDSARPLRRER